MNHKEYFDSMAASWDEMCLHEQSKLRRILEHLHLFGGCRILDVGCGTGIFTECILNNFSDPVTVTCVDLSEKMLEMARKKLSRCRGVSFINGDAAGLGLESGSVDRIICYSCLPHFLDKASALRNLRRILMADGLLVIAHSDGREKINEMHARLSSPVRHDHLPGPAEIKTLLDDSGLQMVEIVDTSDIYIVSAARVAG